MTPVEVLAPVRLETRFIPPALRTDGVNQWMLRLRVYPDEFSMPRMPAPPTPAELDRLAEAVARLTASNALSEADAFASFASSVGAGRALALWRAHVVPDGAGKPSVDRTGEADHVPFAVHGPAGLPDRLQVWLIHTDGTRHLAATLALDVAAIGQDLDLAQFDDRPLLVAGRLPETWWLSYRRAVKVGLGIDLDIGLTPPTLDAIVVSGLGEADAAELVDAHNASARMAVLAPGTPTNTVAGEPTTDFGEHAESVYPLLHVDPAAQPATSSLLSGLTGRVPASALPMLGGDLDVFGPGSLAVQGLWPVLWGRSLRDVTGAGDNEIDLARWAIRNLAVEGPRPAFRVGEQPYGLLPTSAFNFWVPEPGDPLSSIEERIREWGIPWRAGAAARARAARGRVTGADTSALLDVLGLHAPSRYWEVKAIADLYELQALRMLAGMPPLDTEWGDETAIALRGVPSPVAPAGRAPGKGPIPGPPLDEVDDAERLRTLCTMHPEPLYLGQQSKLGLVGHLFREALIAGRAVIGEAVTRLRAGTPIALGQNLPWTDEPAYATFVLEGSDKAVDELRGGADSNGRALAARFREIQEALEVFADLWKPMPRPLFRAVLAALDTAAFRVDPWLTGIAERRLQRMIAEGAPFRLGAYGWVDAPAPFRAAAGDRLAPGPTAAGLLHAPSHAQALTAALLRDAAVRSPGNRWDLTIDSARVRAATALAERVRLGLHPYEALGLEVEKLAGDWDTVRILRKEYPLAADQQERRVCDGQQVLRAAREGTLVPGLPVDLAARIAPLDGVLDTYSDLLVTDGVHALVTGHADLANAAMEAAAGLGAPPDLRAIRTPRQATTVRVSAWALLPPGGAEAGPDADPARAADPAYAAALEAELGAGALHAADPEGRDRRDRFAAALGGAEDEPPVPSLTGGGYEGLPDSADADLRTAVFDDLRARLDRVLALAHAAHDGLASLDPESAGAAAAIIAAAARWSIDLTRLAPADPAAAKPSDAERLAAVVAALADRLSAVAGVVPPGGAGASPPPDIWIGALKRAIRTVAGRPDLPVLPIVARSLLPTLRRKTDCDSAWLEIVAAVRPRLAPLEARQLDPARPDWPAAVAAPDGATDPWHVSGPVIVAYGPAAEGGGGAVAVAALDGWTDSVPSRRHATTAVFGFNAPKSRAPQAVLVAVPPDRSKRLDGVRLVDVVLDTRELAHARAARQIPQPTLPFALSTAFVSAKAPHNFLDGWPQ